MTDLEWSIASWRRLRICATDALGRAVLAGADDALVDRLTEVVVKCIVHESALIDSRPLT